MTKPNQRRPAAQRKTFSPHLGPVSGTVDAASVPLAQIPEAGSKLQGLTHPLLVTANLLAIQTIKGAWIAVRSSMCAFAGRPAADLLGWGWHDLLHLADRDQVAATWGNTAAKAQGYEAVCRLRRFDGHSHRWRLHVVSLRGDDGRTPAWVCLGTDESERKSVEQTYGQLLAREPQAYCRAPPWTGALATRQPTSTPISGTAATAGTRCG